MTSNTPETQEILPVTQADRDAASAAVKSYRGEKNGNWQQRIRDGHCDDGDMVQAFARYRRSHSFPLQMLEALEPFACDDFETPITDDNGWTEFGVSWSGDRIRDWFGPSAFRRARETYLAALTPSALSGDNSQSSSNAGGVGEHTHIKIPTEAMPKGERRDAVVAAAMKLAPYSADPAGTPTRDGLVFLNAAINEAAAAHFASISTPTAEPTGIERSKVVMLERYLRRARRILGSTPSKIADDIDAYFSGNALTTPPTPDRIGKDAVREALLDAKNALIGYSLHPSDRKRAIAAIDAALTPSTLSGDAGEEQ